MASLVRIEKIAAIVPAFNETGRIGRVVEKIKRYSQWVDTVIVIDDCSRDSTSLEAQQAGATVIRHQRNRGVGAAIRTGIVYARDHGYGIGVVLSGDDQHEPAELPLVLRPIIEEGCDFVQGSRYLKGGRTVDQNLFRMLTTRLYPVIFTVLTLRRCTDVTNGFRAFRIDALLDDDEIDLDQPWLDRYELEVYMLYKVYVSKKHRVKEVPITLRYNTDGGKKTSMTPVIDWWRMMRPVIFLRLGVKK